MSKSNHSKELQPRESETGDEASSGLRQVCDDGDADGGAHVSLQNDQHGRGDL